MAFIDLDASTSFISLFGMEAKETLALVRVGILRHMELCSQDVSDLFV